MKITVLRLWRHQLRLLLGNLFSMRSAITFAFASLGGVLYSAFFETLFRDPPRSGLQILLASIIVCAFTSLVLTNRHKRASLPDRWNRESSIDEGARKTDSETSRFYAFDPVQPYKSFLRYFCFAVGLVYLGDMILSMLFRIEYFSLQRNIWHPLFLGAFIAGSNYFLERRDFFTRIDVAKDRLLRSK
jgi:hypothetical protein